MLKTRVLTALAIGALFAIALFLFNDLAWGLFVAGVVFLATGEWARLIKTGVWQRYALGVAAALPIVLFAQLPMGFDAELLSGALYICALALWLFSVPVFLRYQIRLDGIYARFFWGLVILVAVGVAMISLRRVSPLLLLACMAPVWIADIAAYFVGRRWGKTKLAPTISPGKTREGAYGALCAVLLYALVLHLTTPAIGRFIALPWFLLLAVAYTALSIEGDLFESLLKRHANLKDSGTLLPGHGGILDRVDSLLPTLPLAAALCLVL